MKRGDRVRSTEWSNWHATVHAVNKGAARITWLTGQLAGREALVPVTYLRVVATPSHTGGI